MHRAQSARSCRCALGFPPQLIAHMSNSVRTRSLRLLSILLNLYGNAVNTKEAPPLKGFLG